MEADKESTVMRDFPEANRVGGRRPISERANGLAEETDVGDFEVDTRLEGGDGRYRALVSKDWEIWGPNGGYMAALALRAAGREARDFPIGESHHSTRVSA